MLQKQLVNGYQKDFPLCSEPFNYIAAQLNVDPEDVLNAYNDLAERQIISRNGAVFDHKKAGASTLAAVALPIEKLDNVAEIINSFDQVNHNYAREHHYNLWFVVTDKNIEQLHKTLERIENKTSYPLLILPMEASYHIDLSFNIQFNDE